MSFHEKLINILRIVIHVDLFGISFLFACIPIICRYIFAKTISDIANKLNLVFERVKGSQLLFIFTNLFN